MSLTSTPFWLDWFMHFGGSSTTNITVIRIAIIILIALTTVVLLLIIRILTITIIATMILAVLRLDGLGCTAQISAALRRSIAASRKFS